MTSALPPLAAAVAVGMAALAGACWLGSPARRAALPIVAAVGLAWSALACAWGLGPLAAAAAAWGWAVTAGAAALGGGLLAARLGRLAGWELGWASLPPGAVALVQLARAPDGAALSGAPVRALLVLPVVWALCGVFGMSCGLLLGQRHGGSGGGGIEARLAGRFLMAKRSRVLSVVTTISVVGVCLGVWLVLVSLAVLSGFERDLEDKIIASGAHVVVQSPRLRPFVVPESLRARLAAGGEVAAWAPFVSGEVAVRSANNYLGATLVGIDPERAPAVLAGLARAPTSALAALAAPPADAAAAATRPGLILGAEMARGLAVAAGDVVQVISAQQVTMTPLGPSPRVFSYQVAGVVATGMWEFDARHAFSAMAPARRFLGLQGEEVAGVYVACQAAEAAPALSAELRGLLGGELEAVDWQGRNLSLFSALKLERVVAFVVLVFIILVASFSIVNTLAMSIIERRREIAILKTMGLPDLGIVKLFVLQGLWVGGFGTLLGTLAGLASVALITRCRFFLPPDIYYLEALPVELARADVALVVAAALIIVWDFAVVPAVAGARLTPVEGLRDG